MYTYNLTKKEVIATSEVLAIEESMEIVVDLFLTAQIGKKEVDFYSTRQRIKKDD